MHPWIKVTKNTVQPLEFIELKNRCDPTTNFNKNEKMTVKINHYKFYSYHYEFAFLIPTKIKYFRGAKKIVECNFKYPKLCCCYSRNNIITYLPLYNRLDLYLVSVTSRVWSLPEKQEKTFVSFGNKNSKIEFSKYDYGSKKEKRQHCPHIHHPYIEW